MKLIPLAQVRNAVRSGSALDWGVRDEHGNLLLAKGYTLTTDNEVLSLLERGMFVDIAEVNIVSPSIEVDPQEQQSMTSKWFDLDVNLRTLLKLSSQQNFLPRVRESVDRIAGLADENVDLLIYLILRHDHSRMRDYGSIHSLHAAAMCSLLTRRLSWSEPQRQSMIGAALTMNISMLDLQGYLASRGTKPTASERKEIDEHPLVSAKMLRAIGLEDEDWLDAIEQHHEQPDGSGYPRQIKTASAMSRLLRLVDSFTAKHSPRHGRKPQPAQQAARDIFVHGAGDPFAALLIKSIGVYPPGCYVKLANGEQAVVTHRGENANKPIAAAITNGKGDMLAHPIRRDTALQMYTVLTSIPESDVKVRICADSLYK